jgi:hypothetical protein
VASTGNIFEQAKIETFQKSTARSDGQQQQRINNNNSVPTTATTTATTTTTYLRCHPHSSYNHTTSSPSTQ